MEVHALADSPLPYGGRWTLSEWARHYESANSGTPRKGNYWTHVKFIDRQLNFMFHPREQDYTAFPVRVLNTHTARRYKLPVCSLDVPGKIRAVLRYDFENWAISVDSWLRVPDNFFDLFDRGRQERLEDCSGFTTGWMFEPYATDPRRFTLRFSGDYYRMYTFWYLLTQGIGLGGDSQG